MLGANGGDTRVGGFSCFGKGIVTRIEIFAFLLLLDTVNKGVVEIYLQLILQKILLIW